MSFSFTEPTSTHPTAEATPDAPEATNPATDSPDVVPPVVDGEVPQDPGAEPSEPSGGEGDDKPDGEPKPDDSAPSDSTFLYGDQEVEIDIPQDVTDALKEHGLDASVIAAELYAKGGEFKLTDETKAKLDAVYGKFAVDSYIAGLKAQNEGFLHRSEREAEQAEKANTERFSVVAAEVGGDEGWASLERFALDTLDDDKLAAFNAVMESGNQYLQMYAVRELEAQRKAAQGDDKVTLVEATGASPANADNGPMTAHQYITAIANLGKQFPNDRAGRMAAEKALDARRQAGINKGL